MALKLSFIIEAIDRATAPIRAVHRMLEATNGPLQRVSQRWGNLTGQVRGIATNLTLMTGAAAGAFYPLHRMIDEGSQIYDMAKNLAISTREFQRLAYALTLDGGSAEDAGNALKFLERNAVSAALGNQEMATWFRRAGMSAEFLRANLNNPTAMLNQLADAMSQLPEGALRTDLSMALLGRSGNRLNQTLSMGRKGLKEVGDEAESLGVILDDVTIKKMKESGDGMQKVWRVIKSLTAVIAVAAIPLINEVGEAIIEWTKANREMVGVKMKEFFDRISASLPKFIIAVIEIAAALGTLTIAANAIARAMGGWDNVIIALVAVKFVMLLGALAQVGLALYAVVPAIAAIGAAMLANPIALAVAGIAVAALLIYKYWDPIKEFFKGIWDYIVQKIVALNSLVPDWAKRYTLPGIALNAVAGAIGPAGAGQANVGGTIKIEIDQAGRARVASLKSDNPDVDLEVYSGPMMVMP